MFKVGDRVYATWYGNPDTMKLATVSKVFESGRGEYGIVYDHYKYIRKGDYHARYEDELEHAKIANTKINRKLYPNYKVAGEWLEVANGTD